MSSTFSWYVKQLPAKMRALLSAPPAVINDGLPATLPQAGIYLISNGRRHLYVGRSDNLRQRMGLHTRPSAGQNQATLAFRIAKARLRIGKASYRPEGSRDNIVRSATFASAFARAKQEIRSMSVRFVEVEDPIMQTLLEVFAALELRAPYNKFKTT